MPEQLKQLEIIRSEDELGRKWDRCLSDSMLKVGGGLGVGALLSLLFFKRRAWPIIFGTGAGFGMSYSNCQHALQGPYTAGPVRRKPLVNLPPVPALHAAISSSSSSSSVPSKADKSSAVVLGTSTPSSSSSSVHLALDSHPSQYNDREMKDSTTSLSSASSKHAAPAKLNINK